MAWEIAGVKGDFTEADVGLVAWRRVVYHVTHCEGVVVCAID
jgi:hypothetical protein